jgi:hypothetical protein
MAKSRARLLAAPVGGFFRVHTHSTSSLPAKQNHTACEHRKEKRRGLRDSGDTESDDAELERGVQSSWKDADRRDASSPHPPPRSPRDDQTEKTSSFHSQRIPAWSLVPNRKADPRGSHRMSNPRSNQEFFVQFAKQIACFRFVAGGWPIVGGRKFFVGMR